MRAYQAWISGAVAESTAKGAPIESASTLSSSATPMLSSSMVATMPR